MRPDTRQHLTACTGPSAREVNLAHGQPRPSTRFAAPPLRCGPFGMTATAGRAGNACRPARRLAVLQRKHARGLGSPAVAVEHRCNSTGAAVLKSTDCKTRGIRLPGASPINTGRKWGLKRGSFGATHEVAWAGPTVCSRGLASTVAMPRWETGGKCPERTGVGDRSRFEVVVRRLPAYAGGGGRPRSSGTTGSAARNIAVISGGRSRPRWRAVRTTLASTCWVSAPWRVRLPPHTLRMTTAGRMACSARQLVASSEGSHKKRNTAWNSVAKCAAKRSASSSGGGASTSRASRAVSRPRAVAIPCSLSSPALQRSRRSRPARSTACTSPAQGLSG